MHVFRSRNGRRSYQSRLVRLTHQQAEAMPAGVEKSDRAEEVYLANPALSGRFFAVTWPLARSESPTE